MRVEVNRDVPVGAAKARQAGGALTVTVHLKLGPGGCEEDVDRFSALLACLGGDPGPVSPPARGPGLHLGSIPERGRSVAATPRSH